jgi:hypothetical protein
MESRELQHRAASDSCAGRDLLAMLGSNAEIVDSTLEKTGCVP